MLLINLAVLTSGFRLKCSKNVALIINPCVSILNTNITIMVTYDFRQAIQIYLKIKFKFQVSYKPSINCLEEKV